MSDRRAFAIAALVGAASVTGLAIVAASVRPLAFVVATGRAPIGWAMALAAAVELGAMVGWPVAWAACANGSARSGESLARRALGESPRARAGKLAPIAVMAAGLLAGASYGWGRVATGATSIDAARCASSGRAVHALGDGATLLCDDGRAHVAVSAGGFVAVARSLTIEQSAIEATDVQLATGANGDGGVHAHLGILRANAIVEARPRSPLAPAVRAFAVSSSALVAALFVVASTLATRGRSAWASALLATAPTLAGFACLRLAETSSMRAPSALLAPACALATALLVDAALTRANESR